MFYKVLLIFNLAALLLFNGCSFYSFTGATIPSNLNTIAIPLAKDKSLSTITVLDDQFTRLLVDRFVGQTRLSLQPDEEGADATLIARIDRYLNQPVSVSGDERATRNRITLTISIQYVDQVKDKEILSRSFSGFEEYDPIAEGLEGETTAATTALENIADDVFTAATSNW